jgi:hypothetical protein
MLPAMVEVTYFYGTVNFVTVGTWDGAGYRTMLMLFQKKSPKNTVLSTYPVPVEIYEITYMKKVTEFHGIIPHEIQRNSAKFQPIPSGIRNRQKYINRRNYVSMEFRGHPTLGTPPPPHTDGFKADQISSNPTPPPTPL